MGTMRAVVWFEVESDSIRDLGLARKSLGRSACSATRGDDMPAESQWKMYEGIVNERRVINRRYTKEDVERVLGLEHWRVHSLKKIHKNSSEENLRPHHMDKWHERTWRNTGRTTKILVEAMVRLSYDKHLVIRADTKDMTQCMYKMALDMARQLGLDQKKIHNGWTDYVYVQDHMLP